MILKKELLRNFRLYGVTDIRDDGSLIGMKVQEAYRGGVDIVQLRAKKMGDGELLRLALKLREIANNARKLFFVNDRVDIAISSMADGVHVGQDDIEVAELKRIALRAGRDLLIGKSTHSLEQARSAAREGVDYIGVGPVFSTPTKPGRAAVGLDLIRSVAKAGLAIPFVAIGGIDLTNLKQVLDAGANRVACVRALFDQEDVYGAAKQLIEHWEGDVRHGL